MEQTTGHPAYPLSSMRIAFVAEMWLPSVNGVVTRLTETINELLRFGHTVMIIAPDGPAEQLNPWPGVVLVRTVPVFRVGFIYGGQPWGFPVPRVTRYLAEFGPDLIHVISPLMLGIAGVRAAGRLGLPLVASYHTDLAAYAGSYHLGFLRPVIWWLLRGLHGRAQLNLVTSRHAENMLSDQRIGRIRLWRKGVDLRQFSPAASGPELLFPSGPESSDDMCEDQPVALYVGRLAEEKGLTRLEPLARSGRFRLIMVGDGPDRERLQRLFADTTTRFKGTLRGDQLARAYAEADVLVFPSTTETLGLVVMEALASGTPVVSADSPAARELLSGVIASRTFSPDLPQSLPEIIDELLASAPRAELSRRARKSAESWGWQAATAELIDYYEELIADGVNSAASGVS